MIKHILSYLYARILGYQYSCDRCSNLGMPQMTVGIRDYIKNRNSRGIYCRWCWSYIHLKHFNCKCGNKQTLRSAHQNYMTCENCYTLNTSLSIKESI